MDKQDKKGLTVFGGLLALVGTAIGVIANASNDDDDKKTT